MFQRIAIINRGEAAMRLIHAVQELNAQRRVSGEEPITTIALYTDAERSATFVREADIAYSLGPASARPYLDYAVLETALRETRADAAWVGWGFVAEDPGFAELCAGIGVTFIGPSPEAMRRLGDKIGSKLIAEEVGVPVAPWSRGPVDSLQEAIEQGHRIGYPLMLKATAGGGGRGIRVINGEDDMRAAYQLTRDEAQRAFGSGVVFLERLVTGARHVEVQVIADGQGTAWALGVRDCSVQRRNQKVIEESASPVMTPTEARTLKEAAERLAIAVDYAGAGTVEFLFHQAERSFAFLEVNTRLQVEHPITEVTTDMDLVKAQLHVAAGGTLDGAQPPETGHAVEARLNAEDPDRDFAPSPGRIALLQLPAGPGIRVDTGVSEGDTIPADFDSMIAKIIAYGRDRDEALARLRRAVYDTEVVIEGGTTNKSFILDLLVQPEVLDGSADTGWIDRVRGEGRLVSHAHAGVALVAAGIEGYEDEEALERARLLETAHGGRPQVRHEVGRAIDLKLRGVPYRVTVAQVGPRRFRVGVGSGGDSDVVVDAEIARQDEFFGRLTVGDEAFRLLTATHGTVHLIEVNGVTHRVSRDEGGVLRSPAPALVVATPVPVGADVDAGQPVLVLESMKMETVLPAPFAARVKELLVSAGSQVETGAPLVRLEPREDGGGAPAAEETSAAQDLDLPERGEATTSERATRLLEDLRSLVLGFDVDPTDERGTFAHYLSVRDEVLAEGGSTRSGELSVLTAFADLAELSRNRAAGEEVTTDSQVHSPREHFHTYLQSLDIERSSLPETFTARLGRVVRHYGVTDLERTPELEEAVFRIFLAQKRTGSDVVVVSAILQQWLNQPAPERDVEQVREVLDRLVSATQLRFPILGDLARSVRFRWFDQPLVDAARSDALDSVRGELAYLAAHPHAPDYASRIDVLAHIPEQTVRFLAERIGEGRPGPEPMLEALVRRHYWEHELRNTRSFEVGDRPMVSCDYRLDDRSTHLITTTCGYDELVPGSEFLTSLEAQVDAAPEGHESVVDLYVVWDEMPQDPDALSASLLETFASLPVMPRLRRVAVGVCRSGSPSVAYVTVRPDPSGVGTVEDLLVRGVHPMVGRRLNLWRLRDFDITRLDAPEDVLLYHAVAPGNESDQRLVALTQIRQFSVVRDAEGRVVSLPHAERAVASCLEAIRRARTSSGPNSVPLDMNHVWLHIWPVVDAGLDELAALQEVIAPLTVGAGIEEVLAVGRIAGRAGEPIPVAVRFSYQPGSGVVATVIDQPRTRLSPLDDYAQKVLRARRRGTVYPYEITSLLAGPGGEFVEHDLDDRGVLVPVERPPGRNKAGIVAGVVTSYTDRYPDGMTRVVLLGDPTKALGAVAEAECARIIAALDLAEDCGLPLEWLALSAGARISMDSGTENMDWVAKALRRIITFTQAGHEINVVVTGINVGAQPYWNAEATMLMHTKGILVMTPDSAMVLTGKQSLDFSGGVSAEDNFGIGGYDRVMGPNGQAQYWAPDLASAVDILMAHYRHAYVQPGEPGPRPAESADPDDRDVTTYPHVIADSDFRTVGDIFSPETNPDKKKPFDIRTLMRSIADQDEAPLERWAGMADADTSVVFDAHLGGIPVCMLGIESRTITRRGFPPTDGPDTWTAGTLFPRSSKKTARAINAASGTRPLVVIANLSGFDGSPDSMRNLQLEYGAEIGRAVVNFEGPIVFCVVSRYHGGAFVVFSKALNPNMTVLAVEGSFASVIGGAPAAAVVFAGEVNARTARDPRVTELEAKMRSARNGQRAALLTDLAEVRSSVRAEKLSEVASEFDGVHSIERAVRVGSVDAVIQAKDLRPRLICEVRAKLGRTPPGA